MIRLIKKNSLFLIFLIGLIIRLLLIFTNYAFDVNNHIVWAEDLHKFGFIDFFNKQSSSIFAVKYPNYPPLSLFIFYLFYPLPKLIFNFFWFLNIRFSFFPSGFLTALEGIDKRLFVASMLKIPAIISDLGLAWILILFVRKLLPKKKLDLITASLILFNPAFIYNSSLWGQIDSIPIFILMVSVYLLLFTKKDILSGIFLTLSLLVKPTTIIFLPVYSLVFLKKFGWLNSLKSIFFCDLVFWLSFFPFLRKIDLLSPYLIYWQKIISAQSLPYVTNGAFNFWMIITDVKKGILDTTPFILSLSYRTWGYLLVGFFISVILFKLLKSKLKETGILFAFFLTSLVSIIFLTKMHERYLLLPLPFLLLITIGDKKNIKYFFFLSLLGFLNQYKNWTYPLINYLLIILNSPYFYKLASLINILIFMRFAKINSCKS